ncbi:MAG TPA: glucose 1-dehydrogenase [Candidatus Solibacter sp.]|nr:glucose 1-dehydrogenase [Candidatus Solibacter sp.]
MSLQGKAALVTGATTGIGRAIAERFACEGVRVAVNYRKSREAAEEVVSAIHAAGGVAIAVAADVSIDSEVRAMLEQVASEFGRLDVLINNAGWSTRVPHRHLESLTDEIWDKTFDTNLRGVFYCVRAAVPLLLLQPGAAIVNIASVAGSTGVGSSVAYAAAKAGVLTMTKSLARALAPEIRVNAVSPGLIRTNFAGRPDSDSAFSAEENITPLRKLATAEECAEAVYYLAFTANSVTGQNIQVDGGLYGLAPNR